MKAFLFGMSLCLSVGSSAAAAAYSDVSPTRDPTGETADYEIERNNARTSSIIRSGEMTTTVTGRSVDLSESYDIDVDYTMQIQVIGRRSGTSTMAAPEEYFTPEFMENLRANGEYAGPSFKVRHLGYADARNMDGRFYPNCDKILIYDIEDASVSPLTALASSMLSDEIDDMEIVAHIKFGVPVLGAVKLDVTGEYSGQGIKAGADYVAP
jgi:hypothetical protein